MVTGVIGAQRSRSMNWDSSTRMTVDILGNFRVEKGEVEETCSPILQSNLSTSVICSFGPTKRQVSRKWLVWGLRPRVRWLKTRLFSTSLSVESGIILGLPSWFMAGVFSSCRAFGGDGESTDVTWIVLTRSWLGIVGPTKRQVCQRSSWPEIYCQEFSG